MPYLVKRLLLAVPMLLGITFISFLIMKAAPGDPVAVMLDPSISIKDLEQIKQNLGLNQPWHAQYVQWLGRVLQGDLGVSYVTGKPVMGLLLERLPATLLLSITSLLCILCITLPLGIWCGYKKHTWIDDGITLFSFLGMSIPTFWLGLMFILLGSYALGWFPTSGFMDPLVYDGPWLQRAGSVVHHMALPLFTIVVGGIAGLIRYNRFGIIKILAQDYIVAARARGLSETRILFKHAFKNCLLPIITILGLDLPSLISGSYIIEYIFSWPGMGQLGVQAVFQRDYPILLATILFSSVLIILGTIFADIGYSVIDPRISRKSKS
ncbi:ABC transporter permease [bacterium]|nr:ABC transporter permease [bacterium]